MLDDVESKIQQIISPDQWKQMKPLLDESFKFDLSAFLIDFIMKRVDRRIYEPILIEALKKPDEIPKSMIQGKDSTTFENAIMAFKELRVGDPEEAFKKFLMIMQKIDVIEQVIQLLKSDSDSKFEKIEAIVMENKELFDSR